MIGPVSLKQDGAVSGNARTVVPKNCRAGGFKNRNPRNPPKFTKSSVFNRPIVTETCLNQQSLSKTGHNLMKSTTGLETSMITALIVQDLEENSQTF